MSKKSKIYNDKTLPFSIFSSSVNTGYQNELSSSFYPNTSIEGNHDDEYSKNYYEGIIQGTFSSKNVGSRKSSIIEVSSSFNRLNRPERYELVLASGSISVYPPTIGLPADRFSGDPLTKRPFVFKNILGENYSKNYQVVLTGGRKIQNRDFKASGGYSLPTASELPFVERDFNYNIGTRSKTGESVIVSRFGYSDKKQSRDHSSTEISAYNANPWKNIIPRKNLNRDLTKPSNQGLNSSSLFFFEAKPKHNTNKNVGWSSKNSVPNYNDPTYGLYASVMIKFNASYGLYLPEAYMNYSASSYIDKIYSTYQDFGASFPVNLQSSLQTFASFVTSKRFIYCTIADDYTVPTEFNTDSNKMSIVTDNSLIIEGGYSVPYFYPIKPISYDRMNSFLFFNQLSPQYDNGFVTHQIPQNDCQYWWQKKSLLSQSYHGYYTDENPGAYCTSSGVEQQLWTITASPFNLDAYNGNDSKPAVSFAGYCIYVIDPINISTNTSGHPYGSLLSNYRYKPYKTSGLADELRFLERSYISTSQKSNSSVISGTAEFFTALNQYRNGVYGWPSWKQYRTNNSLTRYQRRNSYIVNLNKLFKEPQVSFNKPILHIVNDSKFLYTYENQKERFNDDVLESQTFKTYNETFFDRLKVLDNTKYFTKFLQYTEKIYPNKTNIGLSSIRKREQFEEWWKNFKDKRFTQTKLFETALDGVYNSSRTISQWDLDERKESTDLYLGSQAPWDTNYFDKFFSGKLQQFNSIFYNPLASKRAGAGLINWAKSPIYARPTHSGSVDTGANHYGENTKIFYDTKWEVAKQSGRQPYYQNYDEYLTDIKPLTQTKSLIPEFRISEHMDYYLENGGDFLIENDGFLTVNDASVSSSIDNQFLSTYSLTGDNKINSNLQKGKTPKKIELDCEGLLKFIPYRGFYPVERSVECVNYFSSSYSWESASINVGTNLIYDRPIYSTLFAPGILYNTIKSGIAVDYPRASYEIDITGSNGSDIANETPTIDDGFPRLKWSFNEKGDSRYPFESLLEPENYLKGYIFDIEPTPMSRMTGVYNYNLRAENDQNDTKPLYQLSIHNFLAETINLFIKNGSLSSFVSKPLEYINVDSTKKYYVMLLKMFSKPWEKTSLYTVGSTPFVKPKFYMFSSGSAFGPACQFSSSVAYKEYHNYSLFTPPYFDNPEGSEMALIFEPWKTDSTTYTIKEIVENLKVIGNGRLPETDYNVGRRSSISPDSPTLGGYYALDTMREIKNKILGTQDYVDYANGWMQITSSVNINIVENIKNVEYDPYSGKASNISDTVDKSSWIIQTKFETPIFNFFDCSASTDHISVDSNVSGHCGAFRKGMWFQYANKLKKNEGVYLQIKDVEIDLDSRFVPDSQTTGSLADLVGFDKKDIKLGEISDSKYIREAVVAIPYIESPKTKDKQFFYIDEGLVDLAISGKGNKNLVNTVNSMKRFVFPPRYDFYTNRYKDSVKGGSDIVRPFKMFVFEFEREFTSQDLADIWQNIMPESYKNFDLQDRKISLTIDDEPEILSNIDNLKWMIFKVKQRAEKNYYAKTASSADDARFSFELKYGSKGRKNFIPDYSFNWPYDFMSIVEFAEIDMNVEYGED